MNKQELIDKLKRHLTVMSEVKGSYVEEVIYDDKHCLIIKEFIE